MSVVAMEKVLVVPTSLFHDLGYFQGFSADASRYLPRLLEGNEVEHRHAGGIPEGNRGPVFLTDTDRNFNRPPGCDSMF